MKKKLVLILLLLAASTGYASTIGNPIKPLGDKKLAVTVEPNFMHDRDIKAEGESTNGSKINTFTISSQTQGYAKLTLGVTDYLNLFAKIGSSKFNGIDIKFSTNEDVTIETDSGLSYGAGFNAVYQVGSDELYSLNLDLDTHFVCFLGFNGGFAFSEADADEMYVSGSNAINVSGKIKNQEFQAGIFTGIELFIDDNFSVAPYVSSFWNSYHIKTDGVRYGNTNILNFDSSAEDQFGAGLGVDINFSKNVTFNIEGRFIGGNEISFGGTLKF
ncbi:MAG: hypothetical protein Q8L26_07160 [Candidatus Omnitrophota bacterium]|nr:hypothetical protein [Candidatus Omnitrophota bacterium]